jgi:Protein of unknown function (DUF3224)
MRAVPRAVSPFTNDSYEEEPYGSSAGTELARVHIGRSFSGELEGESTAELLTATTPAGSAAYVALDSIKGRLAGREGTFVLEHHGIVSSAGSDTSASVVPDSGTGELEGISGSGQIAVDADGNHSLELDYELG